MKKKQEADKTARRTQVKDLPKKEKALTGDEARKVKGGARGVAVGSTIRGGGKGATIQIDPNLES